jgi:hypothetical protein
LECVINDANRIHTMGMRRTNEANKNPKDEHSWPIGEQYIQGLLKDHKIRLSIVILPIRNFEFDSY